MTSPPVRPLETALVDLFQHLGIGVAHFAAGQQVRALLSGDELTEWDRAAAAAKAEGSFFISQPLHCAVGTKPG